MFKSKKKATFTFKTIDVNKQVETQKPVEKIITGGAYNELDKKEMNNSKQINKNGANLNKFIKINL